MNIQKLYAALDADEMNSSLGIICAELENQGYVVRINDRMVSSEEFFNGGQKDLEKEFVPVKLSLYDSGSSNKNSLSSSLNITTL